MKSWELKKYDNASLTDMYGIGGQWNPAFIQSNLNHLTFYFNFQFYFHLVSPWKFFLSQKLHRCTAPWVAVVQLDTMMREAGHLSYIQLKVCKKIFTSSMARHPHSFNLKFSNLSYMPYIQVNGASSDMYMITSRWRQTS